MTLIIGLDTTDGSYLLGDSYFGEPDSGLKLDSDKAKIFKRFLGKKEIGFGCCGSAKIENVLHYEMELPKMSKYETCEEYVVSTLRKRLTELFNENGCVDDNGKLSGGSEILICLGGKTYNFDSELSIIIGKRNYRCIGSGTYFATGIMQYHWDNRESGIWKTGLSPEQVIMDAAVSVSNVCSFVQPPFDVLFIKS